MIMVDDRAGSKDIIRYIPPGVKTSLCRLDYGDCMWVGEGDKGYVTVGVERKTVTELLQAITTGRLSGHQLIGMQSWYDHLYLVVDGLWGVDDNGFITVRRGQQWTSTMPDGRQVRLSYMTNYLNTLNIKVGVSTILLPSLYVTAQWVVHTYHWWQKPWDRHKAHTQFYVEPPERPLLVPPSLFCRMMKELDGVGWDKARALDEHFNSIEVMLAVGVKGLMKVPGIGKVMAKRIIYQLQEVK